MRQNSGEVMTRKYMCRQVFYCPRWSNKLPNSSGTEAQIFHENYVNTLAADVLAPRVAKPSTAMVLTM